MNKRFQKVRVDDEAIFVLTTYPWRETSLWVEAFSEQHGRVAFLARSARKRTSESRGILMPFVPLTASWYGENELKTMHRIQWQGGWQMPQGKAIFSAMYVNELMLKLTAREDPSRELFWALSGILQTIATGQEHLSALRLFEWQLLKSLGLAPTLECDEAGEAIAEDNHYWLQPESSPVAMAYLKLAKKAYGPGVKISGAALLSIEQGEFSNETHLQEALRLNRFLLDYRLPEGIKSRQLLQQLQAFSKEKMP